MNVPQHWRLKGQRLRLEGSVCQVCGWKSFPPRRHCPHCVASLGTVAASLDSFTGFYFQENHHGHIHSFTNLGNQPAVSGL